MKKILIAFIGLITFSLQANAQKKISGAIQFEMKIDPVAAASANGMQLSEEVRARMPKEVKSNYELLFTATHASFMAVQEFEDSNSGGGGFGGQGGVGNRMGMGGIMRGMGGISMAGFNANREYYYTIADKKLFEVLDMSDTTYAIQSKLTLGSPMQNMMPPNMGGAGQRPGGQNQNNQEQSAVQFLPGPPTIEHEKTDETKTILGFNCKKVLVKSIRKALVLGMEKDIIDETAVWYTSELGFDFSPNPYMWTEGAVLAIENKGVTFRATSIEYRNVSAKDVTMPKRAIVITQADFQKKQEANRARMMNNQNRQGAPGMMGGNRGMMF